MESNFYPEKDFDSNEYSIFLGGNVQVACAPLFSSNPCRGPFSYHELEWALFGLRPQDFYPYVCSTYGAKIVKIFSNCIWVALRFEKLVDAQRYCAELNKRWNFCMENHYFEESTNV